MAVVFDLKHSAFLFIGFAIPLIQYSCRLPLPSGFNGQLLAFDYEYCSAPMANVSTTKVAGYYARDIQPITWKPAIRASLNYHQWSVGKVGMDSAEVQRAVCLYL
jgi:hypothetical protein